MKETRSTEQDEPLIPIHPRTRGKILEPDAWTEAQNLHKKSARNKSLGYCNETPNNPAILVPEMTPPGHPVMKP
ncbi:hypothetical protein LT330_005897 [Penicillium expansum]|nr:hypothetical protein LT330_005897 [Penicillium expansum]